MKPLLHIAGCGRAARTLARLWHGKGVLRIGQVMNRSLASAQDAVEFIGAGEPVEQLDDRITGDWLLCALPESELEPFALGLACRMPGQLELAFHLSGSVPAAALSPIGVPVAAVHPVRPFADPEQAASGFEGTWCAGEGDDYALAPVLDAFAAIGGRPLRLGARSKILYHASTVAAANFLVTLHALADELAGSAGLPEADRRSLLRALQAATLDSLGVDEPARALTGPIERADADTCRRLMSAVSAHLEPDLVEVYRALGAATANIARRVHGDTRDYAEIEAIFTRR